MYPTSKAWVLLESEFNSPVPQQLTPSIKVKTNPINNQQQQSFTPVFILINITPNPANAFGSTLPIHQPTITPRPAQIGSIQLANLPQQPFNTSANLYIQISPIKMTNKMLPTIIVAQFIKIWDKNLKYIEEEYNILDNKI